MTNIVERLRKEAGFGWNETDQLCSEAADEIARLRAALSEIADGDAYHDGAAKFMAIARAALEPVLEKA